MTRTVFGLVALLAAAPATAQPSSDAAAAADRVREHVEALRRIEREMTPVAGSSLLRRATEHQIEQRDHLRAEVARGLGSLIAAGSAGRDALRRLAAEFPDTDLVRRAEIRAAVAAGDFGDVLELAERLRAAAPRDTQLLRWRAEAYDTLGRRDEALQARQARWELVPEDREAWRALVGAHERAGSLARLSESVQRIRLLHPESETVLEQEIEILHRLGRYDEAARIAAAARGGSR